MKIPKHFMKWFKIYGLMDDAISEEGYWQQKRLERTAWRAYRRGVADTKKKYGLTIPF